MTPAALHLTWPSTVDGRGEWLTLGRQPDGSWWLDARHAGRWPVGGGVERVTAFAHWLREPPPPGRYEKEFLLLDRQELGPGPQTVQPLTVEVLLGRENRGGPELLVVYLEEIQLRWEPADRHRIEEAAAGLLAAD